MTISAMANQKIFLGSNLSKITYITSKIHTAPVPG